jgi:hypothetical protein
LAKRLKKQFQILGFDADASICDAEFYEWCRGGIWRGSEIIYQFRRNGDAAVFCKFDSVVDQVNQNLFQAPAVASDFA